MTARPIDADTRDALSDQAPLRESLYRYLAAAFSTPPTAEQLSHLVQALEGPVLRQRLSDGLADRLQACVQQARQHSGWLDEARQEFMNLFKVPAGQYVMPYESVYRDEREVAGEKVRGLLCGPSAIAVRKWYRLAALEISPEYKDLPDHIAMELAYMAHLCAKECQFADGHDQAHLRRCREMEYGFLVRHLTAWLPMLRDRIHDRSQHAYFRAVADLAVAVTDSDRQMLKSMVGPEPPDTLP